MDTIFHLRMCPHTHRSFLNLVTVFQLLQLLHFSKPYFWIMLSSSMRLPNLLPEYCKALIIFTVVPITLDPGEERKIAWYGQELISEFLLFQRQNWQIHTRLMELLLLLLIQITALPLIMQFPCEQSWVSLCEHGATWKINLTCFII